MSFEIIDFHTHPFARTQTNLCLHKEAIALDADTTLRDMDQARISTFCGSVIQPNMDEGFETLRRCNREALALKQRYGKRYIPGFHVHPDYIEESVAELDFAKKNGVFIVGELVPYMHGWEDYSCPGFSAILKEVEKRGMLVSLHTMSIPQMQQMAKEHPHVSFVFAHPGEKARFLEHVDTMKKYDNVYLDLSGTGLFRYGMLRNLIDQVGVERILFGTDYPICNLQMYVGAIMGEHLTDRERELIFSGNAKRLFAGKNV